MRNALKRFLIIGRPTVAHQQPGVVNPDVALLVTNLEKSRGLASGQTRSVCKRGWVNFSSPKMCIFILLPALICHSPVDSDLSLIQLLQALNVDVIPAVFALRTSHCIFLMRLVPVQALHWLLNQILLLLQLDGYH